MRWAKPGSMADAVYFVLDAPKVQTAMDKPLEQWDTRQEAYGHYFKKAIQHQLGGGTRLVFHQSESDARDDHF